MEAQQVLVEQREAILQITVNRPQSLNALNRETIQELGRVIRDAQDRADIAGVILTGSGEKAFIAGADIAEFADFGPEKGQAMSAAGHEVFNAFENSAKPVVAAINGFALGGGLELAMACHIRIASGNARFGQPEVNLGLTPGYGGTMRLAELIGKGKAIELLLTGDMIKAEEALRLGLVNHVVPQEDLIGVAEGLLQKIATKGPLAVAKCIELMNMPYRTGKAIGEGYGKESEAFGNLFGTEDFKEGTQAFLGKRKPEFTGR